MSTLHVFINTNGIFIKKTLEYVEQIEQGKHFYFVECGSHEGIPQNQYIKSRTHVEDLIVLGIIKHVLFHSLHFYQFRWLCHLRKNYNGLRISWMFWSFEYYQLSFEVVKMYASFSKQFLWRKLLFNIWENVRSFLNGGAVTFWPISKKKHQSIIRKIDQFYSFNSVDYDFIFGECQEVNYHFMPYLDETDLFVQSVKNYHKTRIMVGHNGSPLLNHIEVIDYLSTKKIQQEIVLPLNYGKVDYIKKLKARLKKYDQLTINTLDHKLSMSDYYTYIADVEYFLLNSYCQQGLGNIIYFFYNNSTVYLSEKSSSYHFFIGLGFVLKSIEELLTGVSLAPITTLEKIKNKELVSMLINREKVLNQWREMLKF